MLSLLKKKSEARAGVSEMPPWHPNLRNASRLPDTKVVRTSFFVNGVSIFVAVAALLWFAYQEYKLHDLNRQIDVWQAQIDRDKKESDRFIGIYRKFKDEQAKVDEVNGFLRSKPAVSELIMYIGETLPQEIALDAYEQQATGLTLRGTVRGTPDEATGYATAYLDQLRADKTLAINFGEIAFSGPGVARNPQTGKLSLQLFLKFGPSVKGPKK
jgi:hypothetical protein